MLIWTTRFSRKKAAFAVIVLGLLIGFLIVVMGRVPVDEEQDLPKLSTNEARVAYLESLGWQVDPEPVETLQLLLPEQLQEPYLSYNTLQTAQGFDLSLCCGKQLSRFTYTVTNYPDRPAGIQANLYICEDLPVAGDICCPGSGGFQDTLQFPEVNKE